MLLRSSATVVDTRPGEWWRARRHWARGWTIEVARRPVCGTESPKPTPCSTRRRLCSAIPNCRSKGVLTFSTRRVYQLRPWTYTQSMFQVLRFWELGKLRRVLCLRRRPNECWADHMKRTGVIVARQLKKHNQPRVQTLAMRRVRISAWQMVSCPSDAKGRRHWEESVTWRCDEMWRDEYIKLSKEDYRNITQWKRSLPGRPMGTTFHAILERRLDTETEGLQHVDWVALFDESFLSTLGTSCWIWNYLSLRVFAIHLWNVQKRPRDDSDPWNVAWPSDTHRRLEVLGDNKVAINWMNGAWEVKGRWACYSCPWCGGPICAVVLGWYFSGRELMRVTGVGISFVSRTKLRTHMLIGWWTMVILDLERSGRRLISTIKCKITSYSAVFRWGQKGERTWCGCLDIVVTGGIRYFWESLSWWTCAEECLSDDCWTWGRANGHRIFDSFASDRS